MTVFMRKDVEYHIYQYDAGNAQDILPYAIEAFFMDWLMRKVMVKPPEYPQWPLSVSSIAF